MRNEHTKYGCYDFDARQGTDAGGTLSSTSSGWGIITVRHRPTWMRAPVVSSTASWIRRELAVETEQNIVI